MSNQFRTARELVEFMCEHTGCVLTMRATEIILAEGITSYGTLMGYQRTDWAQITGCGKATVEELVTWQTNIRQKGALTVEEIQQAALKCDGRLFATVSFDRINRFGKMVYRVWVLLPTQHIRNPESSLEIDDLDEAIDQYGRLVQRWVNRCVKQR